ncbi:MAG: beta-ketoacyl synthase chain length factor, partial [Bacteroidota bacterium]
FGTAAGLSALKDANVEVPGAISTGTGYGLIEVSQKFLTDMIISNETIVSPTSFIQSTHNTISSNIALLSKCYAHNNTFAHKGFSFESALTDAQLLSAESVDNILVGAYDEVSAYRYDYMKYMGELKGEPCSNLDIRGTKSNGIIFGEGAAFFVLSKKKSENSYGVFANNKTFYNPEGIEEIKNHILVFLEENSLSLADIDVVVSGICGDAKIDEIKTELNCNFFTTQTILAYKHLCGEYMTSSAFAFWLASKMTKTQQIPDAVMLENRNRQPKNILLYNSHKVNHSLMLFKAC